MKIEHKGHEINFIIEYKKRKSLKVVIEADGIVRISAPKDSKEEDLIKVIKTNADLIISKLEQRRNAYKVKEKIFGDKFLLFGVEYQVEIIEDQDIKKTEIEISQTTISIRAKKTDQEYISNEMIKFYRKSLRKHVLKRVAFYQKNIKIKPREIMIEDSQKAWGTCSSERKIMFNWKLAMAPIDVIDYIVVHEMCHLEHMNHSKSFWTLVGRIMPDYKLKSKWLEYNGYNMTI